MTFIEFTATIALTAVGALLQGTVGIGLTLVAGPALVAIDSNFAPGPLVVAGVVVNLRHLVSERSHADVAGLRRLFIGLPFGVIVGLAVLAVVDADALAIIVGASVVVGAVALLLNLRPVRTSAVLVVGGATTAFAALTAALPGPPFALMYSDSPGPTFRGTAGAFLAPLSVVVTAALVAGGHFGREELTLTASMAPGLAIGLFCARFARPRLDKKWFRQAVLVVSALGGAALILRTI